ncbi:MAG: hypothetical protein Ct9H90mP15_08750 [Candidatus Neomarinimicrobiota bacterium]|nr:MAG: hypothetical protein Ct9H90mP15_08750 [Candidatus Neomarinimicrobiota bacterium]
MLFGSEFGNNSLALPILKIGIMIQAVFGLGSPSLTMSGFKKIKSYQCFSGTFYKHFLKYNADSTVWYCRSSNGNNYCSFLD